MLSWWLPNGNHVARSIILLRASGTTAAVIRDWFQNAKKEKKDSVPVASAMKDILQPLVLDMVVYVRRAAFEQCSLFEELAPKLVGKNYILRDIQPRGSTAEDDKSLN